MWKLVAYVCVQVHRRESANTYMKDCVGTVESSKASSLHHEKEEERVACKWNHDANCRMYFHVVSLQVAFALGVGLSQAFDGDVPSLRRPESLAFAAPAASFLFAGFFVC